MADLTVLFLLTDEVPDPEFFILFMVFPVDRMQEIIVKIAGSPLRERDVENSFFAREAVGTPVTRSLVASVKLSRG